MSGSNTPAKDKSTALLVLDLHRLLHCMETDAGDDDDPTVTWQAIGMRMELLQSLWKQVQHHVLHSKHQQSARKSWEPPAWYRDYEERVYRASHAAQEIMNKLRREEERRLRQQQEHRSDDKNDIQGQNYKNTGPLDLIERIFFYEEKKEQEVAEEEPQEIPEDELDLVGQRIPQSLSNTQGHDADNPPPQRQKQSYNNNNNVDMQEFQKAQQEQIKEAIAMMAAQMKQETARIHTTLKGQTSVLLEEMEDLAERNVEQVTQVAQDVSSHVSSGWKRTWGTWSLLILVVSTFLFTLLTIFMIPKSTSPSSLFGGQKFCRMVRGKQECIDLDDAFGMSNKQNAMDSNDEDIDGDGDENVHEHEQQQEDNHMQDDEHHQEDGDDDLGASVDEHEQRVDDNLHADDRHGGDVDDNGNENSHERDHQINDDYIQADEHHEEDATADDHFPEHEQQKEYDYLQIDKRHYEAQDCEIGVDGQCIVVKEDESYGEAEANNEQEPEHSRQREAQITEDQEREELLRRLAEVKEEQVREELRRREALAEEQKREERRRREEERRREIRQLQERRKEQERLRQQEEERRWQEQQHRENGNWENDSFGESAHQQHDHGHRDGSSHNHHQEVQRDQSHVGPRGSTTTIVTETGEYIEAKGFGAFRDEQLNKPRGIKITHGLRDDLPKGFGAFLKMDDDPPFGGGFGGGFGSGGSFGGEGAMRGDAARKEEDKALGPRDVRRASASGDLLRLQEFVDQHPEWIDRGDKNDWSPLHFGVRSVQLSSVATLVRGGADINKRSIHGVTPLGMALDRLGEQHAITIFLRENGGLE